MKYPKMTWGKMQALIDKHKGMDGVDRFLRGELVIEEAKRLCQVAEVLVAGTEKFIAAAVFETIRSDIKFASLSEIFKSNLYGKIEEDVKPAVLVIHRLERPCTDEEICTELGTDHEEIALAYLCELLSKQPKGESGPLLTNGYMNISYIRGTDGNLWIVRAYWSNSYCGGCGGWGMSVNLAGIMYRRGGHQVISCK